MKKSTLVLLSSLTFALAACEPAVDPNQPVLMNGAKEGEFCGGIAGIACDTGLTCEMEGNYPDAGGTCVVED